MLRRIAVKLEKLSIRRMSRVVQVPVLDDNYAYLLIDTDNNVAAAIDPANPEKILSAAERENVKVISILTTHHHWDHAGGNEQLVNLLKQTSSDPIPVYGGDERIGALTHKVTEGDQISIGNIKVNVFFTPCHTTGHVLYYVDHVDRYLFSGDTIFLAGCGKFFEGTASQMVSAFDKIASLPGDTKVMCGHEYSVGNLKFAKHVDGENLAVLEKLRWAESQRAQGLSTVPSNIAEERTYNPFMRITQPAIQSAVNLPNGSKEQVMAALREAKNNFK